MNYIDTYTPNGLQGHWNNPPQLFEIPQEIPPNLDNETFVEFLYNQVTNQPNDSFGYEATKLVRDLNIGAVVDHGVVEPINRDKIFQRYQQYAQNKLVVEKIRSGMASIDQDSFIKAANENETN